MNIAMLIGNVGQDPEIRSLQNGSEVANFSLATSERWKDKVGEKQERTEWHRVVVFGGLCSVVEKYVKKGSKVFVSGKVQSRKWEDRDGNERTAVEVVLTQFDGKLELLGDRQSGSEGAKRRDDDDDVANDDKSRSRSRSGRRAASSGKSRRDDGNNDDRFGDLDDDIPF